MQANAIIESADDSLSLRRRSRFSKSERVHPDNEQHSWRMHSTSGLHAFHHPSRFTVCSSQSGNIGTTQKRISCVQRADSQSNLRGNMRRGICVTAVSALVLFSVTGV